MLIGDGGFWKNILIKDEGMMGKLKIARTFMTSLFKWPMTIFLFQLQLIFLNAEPANETSADSWPRTQERVESNHIPYPISIMYRDMQMPITEIF